MILIPFLMVFVTGCILFRKLNGFHACQDILCFLSAWMLGIGFWAVAAFFQIALASGYHAAALQWTAALLMILLIAWAFVKSPECEELAASLPLPRSLLWPLLTGMLLMIVFGVQNPYGDWDAWSFWNFRAKFLMVSGPFWQDIYHHGIQAKHPWLLPYWIVFGWSTSGGMSTAFPIISSIVFGVFFLLAVMAGVYEVTSNLRITIVLGWWLATMPYFLTHSISQYADVPMALLLTINLLWGLRLSSAPARSLAYMWGALLGLMAFTKDEGVLSALIFLGLFAYYGRSVAHRQCLKRIGLAFLPWIALVAIVKYWMWPAPSGVNQIDWLHLAQLHRWWFVVKYFSELLITDIYGGFYVLPVFIIFLYHSRQPKEGVRAPMIAWFLIIFIAIFWMMYVLVKANLDWRLWTTSFRLTYQLLGPGVILSSMVLAKHFKKP